MKFYRQLAHSVIYFRLNIQLRFLSTAPFSQFPLFHPVTQLWNNWSPTLSYLYGYCKWISPLSWEVGFHRDASALGVGRERGNSFLSSRIPGRGPLMSSQDSLPHPLPLLSLSVLGALEKQQMKRHGWGTGPSAPVGRTGGGGEEGSQEDKVEKHLRTGLSALNSDTRRYCDLDQGLPPL